MSVAGGSKLYVVRPNLVSWVVACVSTLKLEGSGGMLPQKNFEIYSLRDCFGVQFNRHTLASQNIQYSEIYRQFLFSVGN